MDHMDILSLTRWRATCRQNYRQVSGSLRRTLLSLLKPFVPFPTKLLDIMREHHGVFGGELALSFLLRDPGYTPTDLEIYAADFEFMSLCDAVVGNPHIRAQINEYAHSSPTIFFALRRLIAQTLHIQLDNRRSIYIYRSYNSSATATLSRSLCTALSNFITVYGFGCSHPTLTLRHRALLADHETPFLSDVDVAVLNRLRAYGFTMAVSLTEWPEYSRTLTSVSTCGTSNCTASAVDETRPIHIIPIGADASAEDTTDGTYPLFGESTEKSASSGVPIDICHPHSVY